MESETSMNYRNTFVAIRPMWHLLVCHKKLFTYIRSANQITH